MSEPTVYRAACREDWHERAKDMHQKRRPELAASIAAIEAGEADALAAKLDRLSRSQLDFASLLERAQRRSGSATRSASGRVLLSLLAVAVVSVSAVPRPR